MLTEWSIVALKDGKVDGRGYGYKRHYNPHAFYENICGEKFIMRIDADTKIPNILLVGLVGSGISTCC
jgi:hypothetical protein